MSAAFQIRPALAADAGPILDYWNPIIRDTTVTFSSEEKSPQGLVALMADRRAAGHEFLVAEVAGTAVGHATYAPFRQGNGYARAMEHTIILADRASGRGIGRALIEAVAAHAAARGAHTLIGGVSAENAAGRAFHAATGFREVAVVPEVGWKFGRWHDLVLMLRVLGSR